MKRTLPESEKGVSFRTGRYLVATQDVILAVAASLLSILLIRWLSEPIPGFSQLVWRWLGISLAGVLSGGLVSRIWRQRFSHFGILGLGRLLSTLFIKETMLVVTLLTGWIHCPTLELSFLAIATDLLLSASFLLIPRYIFSTLRSEERAVARSLGRKTALVAGTGEPALTMAAEAEASGRYNVVGFLTTDQKEEGHLLDGRVVYFCEDADDLNTLQWRLGGIDTLLFPTDWGTHSKRTHQASSGMEGQPDHSPMSLLGYAFKRCFDVVLSALLLIVFSPLIGLCALAICIEDGKPVIYRQERIGKNGKPFNILKFRSMRMDAEQGGPALCGGASDDRLTKVGRFLRQHHLDELPQLWNVLRGDMSFIGYRPERKYYIDQIMERNPRYRYLYQIRPGVTSYATLYNGYTDTLEKMLTRLDLDLYYLRNHSVLFDAKVLGLTFLRIIGGKKF